jgi:prevent-host-death family protein
MATQTFNIHEAKTNLSKLIERAERGEETIIARAGKPAARLVAIEPETTQPARKSRIGGLEHMGFKVPWDIKKPFEKEINQMFYGHPDGFESARKAGQRRKKA